MISTTKIYLRPLIDTSFVVDLKQVKNWRFIAPSALHSLRALSILDTLLLLGSVVFSFLI